LPTHCSPLRHLQNLSLKSHQFHNYRKWRTPQQADGVSKS
jgi:hypothetical protein